MNTDFLKAYEDLSNLQEANNKVTGRFDQPIARNGSWFGINPAYSEDELAKMEQEKAEAQAAAEEKEKQQLLNKYLDKISTITIKINIPSNSVVSNPNFAISILNS